MKRSVQKGFTLIEMMVVLVILGVIVSMMVASLNTDKINEHMEIEMVRLQTLLTLAQEEAILQGQTLSLAISENTYRFDLLAEDDTWTAIDDEKIFRERTVVTGTSFALVIDNIKKEALSEGFKLKLSSEDEEEKDQDEEDEDKYQRIIIEASGEVFPFELILRTEDETVEFKLISGDDGKHKIFDADNKLIYEDGARAYSEDIN